MTDIDFDAIRAQVYQRLGLEHDEEAAARDITDPDEIVVDLSGQIRDDRERAEAAVAEAGSDDETDTDTDANTNADDGTDLTAEADADAEGEGSEGTGEPAPTDPVPSDVTEEGRGLPPEVAAARADLTAPPSEPEVVVDPKAHTLDESTPVADEPPSTPPSDSAFDYNRYFETLYGSVPPVEQVESILTFVQQVNSVPAEQQQIIAAIVDGQFDPVAYANYVMQQTGGQQPAVDPDDPDTWDSPAASRQPDPHVARLEAELAQIRQREIARYQQEIVSGVDAAMSDFRRSNPHISEEQFRALAQQVNGQRGWRAEIEAGTNARDAYLRHLTATALADRRFAQTIAPPASAAPAQPAPDPRPRQAANAAIAGTNSPSAPNPSKRRSPLGVGTPSTPTSRPKTREELRAALAAGVAEMTGRD